MEALLFSLLQDEFSDLKILANDKTALDGLELDIYIPSIKLGIEWNGVVHFKPIYGLTKLNAIQERDARKQKTADEKGIALIVVSDLVSNKTFVQQAFT